jgi:predicted transcriptional regulator
LSQILENTNLDRVKQLATPRTATTMTDSRVARAKAMLNTGYNHAEIAEALGVSTTTIYNALK